MPLPENGTPWPPHEDTELAENAAWYSGDTRRLESFYTAHNGARVTSRPAQYSGGVVGAVARWWWGTPAGEGEASAKLHVPLAADIAAMSGDLLFSESIDLAPASDNKKLADYLGNLQADGLDSRLNEGAEVAAALGSAYLRVQWDTELRATPWTSVVHPDGAVPEFRGGKLLAVNLWAQLAGIADGVIHRHIERHEPGWIVHALYEGTATNLGRMVPLQDHPATAHLAAVVNSESAQATGTKRLTVTHVPNMLPNRRRRHDVIGRSDYQGITGLFDAMDEAYSSWWRDIRHGKSRIHVPASYLDTEGVGQGASVNLDRELYVPLQGVLATAKDGLAIQAQQFAIRVAEHSQTCKEWREAAIESAGYSVQSLSSEAGAMTATEVRAKNRRSYMTRGKKARYWTAALREHLAALLEVGNAQLHAGLGADVEVNVEFPDGVQESAMEVSQTAVAFKNAGAASTQTLVGMIHPEWDEGKVLEETNRILAESGGPAMPDPLAGQDAGF